jgi:aspartate aminotransferase-like enzyme
LDNGIFGHSFADFAKIYGAEVTFYQSDYRKEINIEELEKFLQNNHDFKVATLVHCETPSGITNPVHLICPILKKYGIISVVDSVSAFGGEEVKVDEWKMDVVITGSQKCLSAAPGLTIIAISDDGWNKILNRSVPIAGFYCNLGIWKNWYENKAFPYTPPISDIFGLREAIERLILDKDVLKRHEKVANATRESIRNSGLELYPFSGYSNTVTSVLVPDNIIFNELFNLIIKDSNVMIAGAFDVLENKVFRIGHMGENCREEKVYIALKALDAALRNLNFKLNAEIHKEFVNLL